MKEHYCQAYHSLQERGKETRRCSAYVIVEVRMVQRLAMFKEDEYEGEEKLGNS